MRALLLTSWVVLAGCQPQEAENITGRLVHVDVVSTYDDCAPARYVGVATDPASLTTMALVRNVTGRARVDLCG